MARHRASRPNPAKVVGALLIALALLIGISIVPPQTARFPGLIAARLGQAVGRGLAPLPVLCLLVGLIFFVRESLRLSPRVYGLLAGYLAGLTILHLRYPPGREFAAAAAGGAGRTPLLPPRGAIVRGASALALLAGAWVREARASLWPPKPSSRWRPPISDAAQFAAVPHGAAGSSAPAGLLLDSPARAFAL